jgi:hypothetical protein
VFGVSQTPQVTLDHIVWGEDGGLRIAWDAVEEVFSDFIAQMLAAYVRLLRRLSNDDISWDTVDLGWNPSFETVEALSAVGRGSRTAVDGSAAACGARTIGCARHPRLRGDLDTRRSAGTGTRCRHPADHGRRPPWAGSPWPCRNRHSRSEPHDRRDPDRATSVPDLHQIREHVLHIRPPGTMQP